MKNAGNILLALFAAVLLFPAHFYAHPGKTDYQGGHKCWRNCGEWELAKGEYHLHDKDWKPIRLNTKTSPVKAGDMDAIETKKPSAGNSLEKNKAVYETENVDVKPPAEHSRNMEVQEEEFIGPGVFVLIIAALLLILLLLKLKRKDRG